jgi:hypothetical protein
MQVAIDPYSPATAYADLRDDETLNDGLRERAIARARELGAEHVEFWRAPYGRGVDRMAGFVELAFVTIERGRERDVSTAYAALRKSGPARVTTAVSLRASNLRRM